MTSPTHFPPFSHYVVYKLMSAITTGAWVSPWLPSGCQGFSVPRIDGLSHKRGSTGRRRERNSFRESPSFCFIFYLWKVLTECSFMWSLNIRGCPLIFFIPPCLQVCLGILHPLLYHLLSSHASAASILSLYRLLSILSPPSVTVSLGVAVTSPLLTVLCFHLLTSPARCWVPATHGNIY